MFYDRVPFSKCSSDVSAGTPRGELQREWQTIAIVDDDENGGGSGLNNTGEYSSWPNFSRSMMTPSKTVWPTLYPVPGLNWECTDNNKSRMCGLGLGIVDEEYY